MITVIATGRTTAAPEYFAPKTDGGKAYARVNIAVNRPGKPKEGQPSADFFTLKIFGKTADYVNNYVAKGQLIEVQGSLQNESFTDKNGNKRTATVIMVDKLNTLEKAKTAEEAPAPEDTAGSAPFPDDDDELPFG